MKKKIIKKSEMIDPRIRELFRIARKEEMSYDEVISLIDEEIEGYDYQLSTADWMKERFAERFGKLNPTTKMSDESKPSSNNGESELTQKESDE